MCQSSAMADADKDFPYRIAYDEAVRALSQQQSMIDSLRTRAGLLLSAAAITTSFLGAQALNDGGPRIATWLALASFVGLSIASLAILWPHSLEFTANPANVIESYIETEEPLSVAESTATYPCTCMTAMRTISLVRNNWPPAFVLLVCS
jgi:hypothetical protein